MKNYFNSIIPPEHYKKTYTILIESCSEVNLSLHTKHCLQKLNTKIKTDENSKN